MGLLRDVECDYGEATPQSIAGDRFGAWQDYRLRSRRKPFRHVIPGDLRAPIKRLSMVWRDWSQHFSGSEHHFFTVDGRELEIRSYTDGRIKIFLDNDEHPIYAENVVPIYEHGVPTRRYRIRKTYADNFVAEQYAVADRRIEEVRAEMEARRQKINTQKE